MPNELPTEPLSPPEAPEQPKRRTPFNMLRTALIGLFVLASLYTLYFAQALLLPIVLALFFALVLSPAVNVLKRFLRIPAPIGAALILAILLGGIGSGIYSLADPAMEWLERAPQSLRQFEYKIRKIKKPVEEVKRATEKVQDITRVGEDKKPREVAVQGPNFLTTVLSQLQSFLVTALSTIILLYFLLATGDVVFKNILNALPERADKLRAVSVTRAIKSELGHYLFTVTYINVGLGIATATAMYFLGMPNPILWGVMVAVLNYMPYFGATVSLIVLSVVAVLTFVEITHALLVPVVFLVLTTIEGQILNPLIVGKRLTLNPVVIFIGLLFWGWIWGILGALIAVPILVSFKIFCDHVHRLAPIGELMTGR